MGGWASACSTLQDQTDFFFWLSPPSSRYFGAVRAGRTARGHLLSPQCTNADWYLRYGTAPSAPDWSCRTFPSCCCLNINERRCQFVSSGWSLTDDVTSVCVSWPEGTNVFYCQLVVCRPLVLRRSSSLFCLHHSSSSWCCVKAVWNKLLPEGRVAQRLWCLKCTAWFN